MAAGGDGQLDKLDTNLAPLWTTTLRLDGKPLVDLAPAADGSVAVATRDAGGNNVHLVSATAAILQSWSLANVVCRIARSSDGNTIYAGTENSGVRALSSTTGATLWSDLKHAFYIVPGPSNRIYVAGDDTNNQPVVACLNSDGTRRWTYSVGGDWTFQARSFAVHGDGRSVVGTRNHELHAVSATGTQLWRQTGLGAAVVSLVIAGNDAVAGRGDGVVTRVTLASGAAVWSFDVGDRADVLLAAADRVYVGTWHGVWALDAGTGAVAWFRETQGGVLSLARRSNRLYAGSRDGWVYCIEDPRGLVAIIPNLTDILGRGTVKVAPIKDWPGVRKPPVPPGPGPGPDPAPRPVRAVRSRA